MKYYTHLNGGRFGVPPKKANERLASITKPHIDSFNSFLSQGLRDICKHMPPLEFELPNGQHATFTIISAAVSNPEVEASPIRAKEQRLFPAECRLRRTSYLSPLKLVLKYSIVGRNSGIIEFTVGNIPIMVRSKACNLYNLSPKDLIKKGEEADEIGGYFVINGNEKLVRMLIQARRNYPLTAAKSGWKKKGPNFTEFGCSIRSVSSDHFGMNLFMHYVSDGTIQVTFFNQKEQFFIPLGLLLKALTENTDKEIYKAFVRGQEDNTFYQVSAVANLRQVLKLKLTSKAEILAYIGRHFRVRLSNLPAYKTETEVALYLLKYSILVHLEKGEDKFNLLIYMAQKLLHMAKGQSCQESQDNPMNWETLLPGHLYTAFLRERLDGWLVGLRMIIERNFARASNRGTYEINDNTLLVCCNQNSTVTKAIEYFFATGNLITRSGLALLQTTGLAVGAEKLNFLRFISHFGSIHRGSFFTTIRSSEVRILRPECWGFICTVHTPDGTPCGLLNHLTHRCQIQTFPVAGDALLCVLTSLGLVRLSGTHAITISQYYPVLLDGSFVGYIRKDESTSIERTLRALKCEGKEIPNITEICLVQETSAASQYPGLYIFTTTARFIRPVHNIRLNCTELIGIFEQVYMHIAIQASEIVEGLTEHVELDGTTQFSVVAAFSPFPEYNACARNIYQCQMAKQTMGTPCANWKHRADNKMYRIAMPQAPMVKPKLYDDYSIDTYPLGTNAIVAVMAYTGYDMEDAMVINMGSYQRGFGHGYIYKSDLINLRAMENNERAASASVIFNRLNMDETQIQSMAVAHIGADGLPLVGTRVTTGMALYITVNLQTGKQKAVSYKGLEECYIDKVCLLTDASDLPVQAIISYRIPRRPTIGDKWASRHGQKGICSFIWPTVDMPFTESGVVPDLIFNPHSFPSRMTVGKMIELMAGKSAAVHGIAHDATPFQFDEKHTAHDYFGHSLLAGGYQYWGEEMLSNGLTGRQCPALIFTGIVYYQRLRHMVSDKFQVRSTGPYDSLTQQPVQGRSRGGGMRFGEMERDAIISYGTSFLLQDRLLNCSDKSMAYLCEPCGSIVSTTPIRTAAPVATFQQPWRCNVCGTSDHIKPIIVPYVFRYLAAECAAMNIRFKLKASDRG